MSLLRQRLGKMYQMGLALTVTRKALHSGIENQGATRLATAGSNSRIVHAVLGVVWIGTAVWSLWSGLDYYRLPLAETPYSDLHEWYKPSGFVGHGYGIVGSLMMTVGVAMYSLRKRITRLHSLGKLRNWLTAHIFLCTLGPYLVLLHTAFRFGGVISIAFWSMVLVVFSGVFGRYVYTWLPKTVDGEFVSESLLKARRKRLISSLASQSGVSPESLEAVLFSKKTPRVGRLRSALYAAVVQDLVRRKQPAKFERRLQMAGVGDEMRKAMIPELMAATKLQQQILILAPFQRLFGYWHVFHLPLAIVMFLIMVVHIVVAVTFGYGWVLT